MEMKTKIKNICQTVAKSLQDNIIGPMEKGFEIARIQAPPARVVDGVDLRILPKFICYRAALLREKLSLQYGIALLAGVLLVVVVSTRIESARLYKQLREKEYILAPGVQDFTPVSPQSVPDSHVVNAAMDFLNTFGNINPVNIDEQYARLESNMSQELKVRFNLEAISWKAKVKSDGISQIFSITEKEIRTKRDGYYEVTAIGRKESYANHEFLGSTEEVIEMILKLIPPQAGKRWYLEIEKLESHEASAFRVRKDLSGTAQPTGRASGGGK